ncbi:hypothetical protein RJ639_040474 [Escallonia herrerae]|uniref:Folate-biopterin transporter 3 n=1 Tax=Escallonia herrerae TaxID=1293975 RepID=A0AA88WEN3_9ASTE|nr:hypothetical protein RJ639_040474 [Escallonia herrerae]
MVEEEEIPTHSEAVPEKEPKGGMCECILVPIYCFKMLAMEMHWSFVFGEVMVYGVSQGLGGALSRVGTEYYMKDVQKVQPSEAQAYAGITNIPWLVKPIGASSLMFFPFVDTVGGLILFLQTFKRVSLTSLLATSHNRCNGVLGILSMLFLSLHRNQHIVLALLSLTAGSAGVAMADVTIDACVAENSGAYPSLAPDMQSLCSLSSSIGALIGFSLSGIFVYLIGPEGVYGLLTIPFGLVLLVGIFLREPQTFDFAYGQVNQKFLDAAKTMWKTLKCPDVWRPCLFMYLSFAISLNIYEGMFYWLTDSKADPSFSQETIGYILSLGSVGSYGLKDHPFRDLLFWTQLLLDLSGMLDLVLVLRLNLKLGIPDSFFVVIDESISRMTGQLKWMPLLVLSSRLCPPGIEGTFFALLMSIDNAGLLSSSWGGGLLLHILKVTRTQFEKLWLAILIGNILRVAPLCLLFLVPRTDPNITILPTDLEITKEGAETPETENIELLPLVENMDGRQPWLTQRKILKISELKGYNGFPRVSQHVDHTQVLAIKLSLHLFDPCH